MLANLWAQDWLIPAGCAATLMIIGAIIDGWKLKVPNWLTFPMIVSGWVFWAFHGFGMLQTSVSGTFVAGALLIIPYMIGGMGAGDVKLYAGFGAWVVPIREVGFQHLFNAFAISVIVGGVLAVAMIIWRRSMARNLVNAQAIVQDWTTSGSLAEIFAKAKERKPSLQLLPYGVPLTIGSLAYLAYLLPGLLPV